MYIIKKIKNMFLLPIMTEMFDTTYINANKKIYSKIVRGTTIKR